MDRMGILYFKQLFLLPRSTPNNGIYILFKILPVSDYINSRQLIYVFRNFNSCNPVIVDISRKQWETNSNWSISVSNLFYKYNLQQELIDVINTIKKSHWKSIINNAIFRKVHNNLITTSTGKRKLNKVINSLSSNHILWESTDFNGSCKQTSANLRHILYSLPAAGNFMTRGQVIPLCKWCNSFIDTNEHFIDCTVTFNMNLYDKIAQTIAF